MNQIQRIFHGYLSAIQHTRGSGLATLTLREHRDPTAPGRTTCCFCDAGHGLRMLDVDLHITDGMPDACMQRRRWVIDEDDVLVRVDQP